MGSVTTVTLHVDAIDSIQSQKYSTTLELKCRMSQAEMRVALEQFLHTITDATWYEWLKELAPEYLKPEEQL